ncbi:hypothetical protein CALCODRAFT_532503 [Calocera cornea HHB12733]|uniref:DUF6532 domain-containing protein n=1 Tax=Calocera cornea HHB12733 TaxID=1353952 RepID=A0A165CZY9_9BASI|nr:hypothetical protein CALCODRAFT_532503 [Calocera cornea HHB12733]
MTNPSDMDDIQTPVAGVNTTAPSAERGTTPKEGASAVENRVDDPGLPKEAGNDLGGLLGTRTDGDVTVKRRDKTRMAGLFMAITKNMEDSLDEPKSDDTSTDKGKQPEVSPSVEKKRRLHDSGDDASSLVTINAPHPIALAKLQDGGYVLVFQRLDASTPIQGKSRNAQTVVPVKQEDPEVIEISKPDDDVNIAGKTTASEVKGGSSALKSSSSKNARHQLTLGTTRMKLGQTKSPAVPSGLMRLEKRLIAEAIAIWQLQQACLDLYPSATDSEEWAKTALTSARAGLMQDPNGAISRKDMDELLGKRGDAILLAIRNAEGDLLSKVLKAAATELPVVYQGIFTGAAPAIAWRVRHLLEEYRFIYYGNSYAVDTEENNFTDNPFLSKIMIAVISSVWKTSINSMEDSLFDPMPLGIIAVATCGIYAYLKHWWDGVESPTDAVQPGELEETYRDVMQNLETFEESKPEDCLAVQTQLTLRVRQYGSNENNMALSRCTVSVPYLYRFCDGTGLAAFQLIDALPWYNPLSGYNTTSSPPAQSLPTPAKASPKSMSHPARVSSGPSGWFKRARGTNTEPAPVPVPSTPSPVHSRSLKRTADQMAIEVEADDEAGEEDNYNPDEDSVASDSSEEVVYTGKGTRSRPANKPPAPLDKARTGVQRSNKGKPMKLEVRIHLTRRPKHKTPKPIKQEGPKASDTGANSVRTRLHGSASKVTNLTLHDPPPPKEPKAGGAYKLDLFSLEEQETIQDAKIMLRLQYFTINLYPPKAVADEFYETAVTIANRKAQERWEERMDAGDTRAINGTLRGLGKRHSRTLITHYGSWGRNLIKTVAQTVVRQCYSELFVPGLSESSRRKIVTILLHKQTCLFESYEVVDEDEGSVKRTGTFRHPAIKEIIAQGFFGNGTRGDGFRFPELFTAERQPDGLIAAAGTALCFAVGQYSTGKFKDSTFEMGTWKHEYEVILNTLKYYKTHRRVKYDALMQDLLHVATDALRASKGAAADAESELPENDIFISLDTDED